MSQSKLAQLLTRIEDAPDDRSTLGALIGERKIVVYGHGNGFITFSMFVLEKYGLRADVILDTKFREPTLLAGVSAMSPEHYRPTTAILHDAVVVITIGKRQYHTEIVTSLKAKGFEHIIFATDIYEYHLSHAPASQSTVGIAHYRNALPDMTRAFDLLADARSRQVFLQLVQIYAGKKPMPVSFDPIEQQYFPEDVILHAGYSRLINCGSYDGDTVRNLRQKVGRIDALACFEPDTRNFKKLSAYLYANKADIAQEIVAFPCGVWSENSQLGFAGNNETNSTISQSAERVLQCVAIDDVLVNFRPTCINMDVEGAEPQALAGARQTLSEHRPDLAISVYHEPQHLWEIVNDLESWVTGYEFFLRNYTGFPAETVLYATWLRK